MDATNLTHINVPFPDVDSLHLKIKVGACRLRVTPGDGAAWVVGTYHDPTGTLPARIEPEGGNVTITQEVRTGEWWNLLGGNPPRFDLALGKAKAYMLTFEVGASESSVDLGGLPITRLLIKQGAGKAGFDFSAPNPQPMSLLDLDAGAVGLDMKNLANANFAEMSVDGGAAAYQFDFGGVLLREAHVRITTGMSSVEIRVPASSAARIATESFLGSLDIGDGLTKQEGAFWTQAAAAGRTPVLTIHASITLGGLQLQTT